jgi:uncharacterized protein YndB with AHSA1/START domain
VTREVQSCEHDGHPARVVIATCAYDTEIEDLWDAITNAERIPRWFLPISGDLRLGGRYQFQGNAGGEISACDPPRHLAVTWEFGGQATWLHVRLTRLTDGGTQLRLEHITHVPDEHWDQYGPGATGVGWDLVLMALTLHLTSEATVDPKEAAIWMASEDGEDFMRRSSEAWCRASIAGGADEAAAMAAASRATAFYVGPRAGI